MAKKEKIETPISEEFKRFMKDYRISGKLASQLLEVNLFYAYQLKSSLVPVLDTHVKTLKVRYYQYLTALQHKLKSELLKEKIIIK